MEETQYQPEDTTPMWNMVVAVLCWIVSHREILEEKLLEAVKKTWDWSRDSPFIWKTTPKQKYKQIQLHFVLEHFRLNKRNRWRSVVTLKNTILQHCPSNLTEFILWTKSSLSVCKMQVETVTKDFFCEKWCKLYVKNVLQKTRDQVDISQVPTFLHQMLCAITNNNSSASAISS